MYAGITPTEKYFSDPKNVELIILENLWRRRGEPAQKSEMTSLGLNFRRHIFLNSSNVIPKRYNADKHIRQRNAPGF